MNENRLTAAEIERVTRLAREFLQRRPWLAPYVCEDDLAQEAHIGWYACADVKWPLQALHRQFYKIVAQMLPGGAALSEVFWLERAYRNGGLPEDDVEAAVELGWLERSQIRAWRKRLEFWNRGRCYSLAYLRWQRRLTQLDRIRAWLRGDPVIVEPDPAESTAELAEQASLRAEITELLASLKPQLAQVLRWSFGLEDTEEVTDVEIGRRIGRSADYINQMRQVALRNMRHPIRSRRLREYYSYYKHEKTPEAPCSNL